MDKPRTKAKKTHRVTVENTAEDSKKMQGMQNDLYGKKKAIKT